MTDFLKAVEAPVNPNVPDLRPGDAVSVHVRIKEGERERIQEFKGTVIRLRHGGVAQTFTVRRIASNGVGLERTFLMRSPRVDKVVVDRHTHIRGARVLIPSDLREPGWRELFQRLDGILFTGGGDMAVEHFKGEAHPKVTGLDEARDAIDLGLVRSVAEAGKPFLGICRGLQATNVALGGTLYTDILDQVPNALQHDYQDADIMKERTYLVHPVRVEEGSRIGGIFGQPMLQVNSLHHQGIKDLAPGLKTVAFAPRASCQR